MVDAALSAWALRNARVYAPDPARRQQIFVASALLGYEPVHRAQVGRWESGSSPVTFERVRRYEDLLGYPRGTIECTIDVLHRSSEPVRFQPLVFPPEPVDIRDVVARIELALSEDRMTGLDWYDLSRDLGRCPFAVLRPRDWRGLFERCLLELAVTVGLEYALREEALARLAGHPQSGAVIAAMAREVLLDPHAQVYNDTVTLLMHCDHPDAARLLLQTLDEPVNNDALRAALLALSSILRGLKEDRRTSPMMAAVAQRALGFVRDESRPLRVRRQAANLLRSLHLPQAQQLAYGLHHRDLKYAASVLLEGRVLERTQLRRMHVRVRDALESASGSPVDPVLDGLIRTALEDSDDFARSVALRALMLVPQRPLISRAVTDELSRFIASKDWPAVHECLELLIPLADGELMGDVVDLLLDPRSAPELVLQSGIVFGNGTDSVVARADQLLLRVAARAIDLIRSGTAQRLEADVSGTPRLAGEREDFRQQMRGLVYALGMNGRLDLIADVRAAAEGMPCSPGPVASRGRCSVVNYSPSLARPLPPPEDESVTARGASGHLVMDDVAIAVCDWWLSLPSQVRPAFHGTGSSA